MNYFNEFSDDAFFNGNMKLMLIDSNYACTVALFKRFFSDNSFEYIVAEGVSWYQNEVSWVSGSYYDDYFSGAEKYREILI